jgi:hypothetical protein
MQRPFITRAPTTAELTLLRKFLGSYRDGSGNNRETNGTSRADSRQIERCFAELLYGKTTESKSFYDFALEFSESGTIVVRAASVKSKEIKNLRDFADASKRPAMRAHFEISNSSAKDWKLCHEKGLTEVMFRDHQNAAAFGEVILQRQNTERVTSEKNYIKAAGPAARVFMPEQCVFISVLYSPMVNNERMWLVSTYPVLLPPPVEWAFRGNCIVGRDAAGGIVYEWYALSGSQFKYYPLLSARLHGTNLFEVPIPALESLRAKSARFFGD